MMKTRTKSILIILVTLLIGIAIGFELSEILIKQRFTEFRRIREPRGFINIFNNIIKPDEKQKPVIDSIVLKHHKKVNAIMTESRIRVAKQMDSLQTALKPHLTKEQMERFSAEISKMKRVPRPGGRKEPPMGEGKEPPPDFERLPPPPHMEDQ